MTKLAVATLAVSVPPSTPPKSNARPPSPDQAARIVNEA